MIIIKVVHLPFRPRDGQAILILKKDTVIRRWTNWPREFYFLEQNLFLSGFSPRCLPPRKLAFPHKNAYKLSSLHLTSKAVCKQEAAKVGGCETCKMEDSPENATVEQGLELATCLLSSRVMTKPVHPQQCRKRPWSYFEEPW